MVENLDSRFEPIVVLTPKIPIFTMRKKQSIISWIELMGAETRLLGIT